MLTTLLESGGWVMWVLMAFSVITLTISLFKLLQFYRLGVWHKNSPQQAVLFWKKNQPAKALETLTRQQKHSSSRVLSAACHLLLKHPGQDQQAREESLRIATHELFVLRRQLRLVELIAGLSPLLGLLGTVLGMITAFQQMQLAGAQVDPSVLSGGIWEALLTTAAGLCVAVPAMIIFNFLEQQLDQYKHLLEDSLGQVFNHSTEHPQSVAA